PAVVYRVPVCECAALIALPLLPELNLAFGLDFSFFLVSLSAVVVASVEFESFLVEVLSPEFSLVVSLEDVLSVTCDSGSTGLDVLVSVVVAVCTICSFSLLDSFELISSSTRASKASRSFPFATYSSFCSFNLVI